MLSTLRSRKRHQSYRCNAPGEDSRSRVPCDFRVSHATPTGALPESWRNRCLRRRRRSWFCHGAWLKSAQCISPSRSIAGLCQILHETQLVCEPLAGELHGVHSLADQVQSQSAGLYLFEGPAAQRFQIECATAVTKEYFEAAFDFAVLTAFCTSKIQSDGLIEPITVGMPHDVRESFIDRAGDRPALHCRES